MTRDERIRELSRMSKTNVLAIWKRECGSSLVWSAFPPSSWSKDELINDILTYEYSGA